MNIQTAGDLILTIRDGIPDPVADPSDDGAYSAATLFRWINEAMDEISGTIPCVYDWTGIQSQQGMDLYELDPSVLSVEQLWYDLWPCNRLPEIDTLFTSKVQSRSYYFGPHSIGAFSRLQVWPAADRTGVNTTLASPIGKFDTTVALSNPAGIMQYGYMQIENEIIAYRRKIKRGLNRILCSCTLFWSIWIMS